MQRARTPPCTPRLLLAAPPQAWKAKKAAAAAPAAPVPAESAATEDYVPPKPSEFGYRCLPYADLSDPRPFTMGRAARYAGMLRITWRRYDVHEYERQLQANKREAEMRQARPVSCFRR
jgi:hypothetical protein